ncbi:IS200/IS605 family transposase [Halorhodospira abdelmalekii]|uniref:IS200/IS605 family transposase n=1 Tax=Halorhodospira abdelmalekii TaxID=421629 RepID=UPI001905FF34|nr:IS200/IS605 family transposase [Halorhodospira abdelmalekii]MBK1736270.1 IS200/IS605 family transposase [Halorhodospira abdelmalekii]
MGSQALKKLYHCTFRLQYHLVVVTKYRRPCITQPMLSRLEAIARATTEKWEGEVLEFNGEPDHLHLLLELTPRTAPSAFVNNLKTVTSRLIRKEFGEHLQQYYWREPVFWSRSYCIITVGGAPLSVLKQYIEQQEAPE